MFSHAAYKAFFALGQDSISLLGNLRAIQHGGCHVFVSRCGSFSSGSPSRGSLGTSECAASAGANSASVEVAAAALMTRVGAPDEVAAAALGEAAAPETKRRRILGKRVSAASHVVPRADDAEAASATGPAIAYHAEIGAAPADDAQPATRRRWKSTPTLAEAASAPEMWPSSLLFLKSENICRRFRTESRRFEDVMDKDEVAWENPLGRGPFGTVY